MRGVGVRPHERFEGVFRVTLEDGSSRIATLNLSPGRSVYGEQLLEIQKKEYRLWDPYRSKLAAAILRDIKNLPVMNRGRVLYLGAATGTTASHVSDIVGEEGSVFCVEFASRVMRELIDNVCVHRPNMYPVLADARFPERYASIVRPVDAIYCDVAQPEQAKILADNADTYLKPNGAAMIAIKSRSVDVTMKPSAVFEQEKSVLEHRGFRIMETVRLEPYQKDHAMIVVQRPGS